MHPVLLRVPLPDQVLSLGGGLLLLALVFGVLALVGWRREARRIVLLGSAGGILCVAFALALGRRRLMLDEFRLNSGATCAFIGCVAALGLAQDLLRRSAPAVSGVQSTFLVALMAGLLGARLGYAIEHRLAPLEALDIAGGGLALPWGLLVGGAALVATARHRGQPLPAVLDAAAVALPLALFMGWVGAYLVGSCYGSPLKSAHVLAGLGSFPRWPEGLVSLGAGAPAWADQVRAGLIDPDRLVSQPVHPSQLYSATAALLILLLAMAVRRRRQPWETTLVVLFALALERGLLDAFRGDPERGSLPWALDVGLWWGLVLLIAGAGFALGPARSLPAEWRLRGQILGFFPAIAAWFALRGADPAALTSGAVLGSGVLFVVGLGWARLVPSESLDPG